MVSDNVSGLSAASFPKEVELRLGRNRKVPPMILISGKNGVEAKHYSAWLQKPFTPQILVQMIESISPQSEGMGGKPETDDQNLQSVFESAFPHESDLARETFRLAEKSATELKESERVESMANSLWGESEENSLKYTENTGSKRVPKQTDASVNLKELDQLVSKKLDEVLPAIVEKIVQDRLDKLLSVNEPARKT